MLFVQFTHLTPVQKKEKENYLGKCLVLTHISTFILFFLFAVGMKFLLVYVRYPDSFFHASSINFQICITTHFMKYMNDRFVNFWSENVIRSSGKFPRCIVVDENRSAYLIIFEPQFWLLDFSAIAPFTALKIGRLNEQPHR